MRTFNHETIIVDEIIAAKKTFKQHQNDGKAIRDIQTIIEDTKIAIDNIQEVLSNSKLIQQVWLRIRNADTSIGDEILGTKEHGNNGSRYRPYLTLDGKNIIEIC
ncbi:MAG: hypothetical protein HUK02_08850, partial [Bacteroidaceae bacterium]|nr:hypothetical protein [Bacteroidaceae bacterium]